MPQQVTIHSNLITVMEGFREIVEEIKVSRKLQRHKVDLSSERDEYQVEKKRKYTQKVIKPSKVYGSESRTLTKKEMRFLRWIKKDYERVRNEIVTAERNLKPTDTDSHRRQIIELPRIYIHIMKGDGLTKRIYTKSESMK